MSDPYLDAETGLYYYRARFYNPDTGRFLQTDPIGSKDDLDLYAYTGGDPVNGVDPTGTEEAPSSGGGGGTLTLDCSGGVGTGNCNASTSVKGYNQVNIIGPSQEEGGFSQLVSQFKSTMLAASNPDLAPGIATEQARTGGYQVSTEVVDRLFGDSVDSAALGGMMMAAGVEGEEAEWATQFHHAFPQYLGGAADQLLEPLPKFLHDAYHSGLDKILPRKATAEYYAKLTGEARAQMLQKLGEYTKAFDAKRGTQLYDAMVREGFPATP